MLERQVVVGLKTEGDSNVEANAVHPELILSFEHAGARRKGVVHEPQANAAPMDPKSRDALLRAIARSRSWIDEITSGKVSSLNEIAARENLVERYVRRLSLLAFLSPRIFAAVANGSAPAALTVSRITDTLPHSWPEQERALFSA